MRRRDLALAGVSAGLISGAWAQGGPIEGRHFVRLGQPLPASAGKVEVIEFFLYTCSHCFAFDPLLEAWAHQLPPDVSFRRIPVGQLAVLKLHQRMFYALEALGALTPAVHSGIFNAFHRQRVEANDEAAVLALVGKLGVDTAKFKSALGSFSVQSKPTQGLKLAELAGVEGVPALVIGGRYRTAPGMGGSPGGSEEEHGRQALAVADVLLKQLRATKVS
ncbi:disulfide bond formation protein DsbA [Pelomonas sp. HMWF004]|nr:disulfide bond formation protein DsbA [Pelomonas sp. HMWF004]